MSDYLKDKDFLSHQKTLLLQEKNRLEKELKKDDKFPQYGDTEWENSSEVEATDEEKGIENQFKPELKNVILALDKIDKNEYGICENCQKNISKERLEAMPSAQICLECSENKNEK